MGKNRGKRRMGLRGAGAMLAMTAVLGCTPIVRHHGYVPSEADLSQIRAGQTSRASVVETFGPPKTTSALVGTTDYYVYSRFSTLGPFAPRETAREVVAVRYTTAGTVADVARYGLEDGRVVRLNPNVTDDGIPDVSILAQLLGAVGQVDAGQLFGGN